MARGFRKFLEELVVEGHRLGRHINHDIRSLDYNVEKVLPVQFSQTLTRTHVWRRAAPAFDQGNVGSCVGNSVAGLLMTEPFWRPSYNLTEGDALKIYETATSLDPFPGSYPPDDTGTDGLDGMKAAKKLGYDIFAYYHIFDFQILLRYLSWVGPAIFGLNWYTGFDSPSSTGLVQILPNDTVRGGHEVELIGVDTVAQTIRFVNSWGPNWADHGCGQFSWSDFQRLMSEDSDQTVAIPSR